MQIETSKTLHGDHGHCTMLLSEGQMRSINMANKSDLLLDSYPSAQALSRPFMPPPPMYGGLAITTWYLGLR